MELAGDVSVLSHASGRRKGQVGHGVMGIMFMIAYLPGSVHDAVRLFQRNRSSPVDQRPAGTGSTRWLVRRAGRSFRPVPPARQETDARGASREQLKRGSAQLYAD